MDPEQAATIIQAHFRHFLTRKGFQRQRAAACSIQGHVRKFLDRRQAAKEDEQEQRAARFKAVMARHRDRIQSLEQEKRLIQGLAIEELDALHAKRHAAATTIQAYWRGALQRQQLRQTHPAISCLRPLTCSSPTLPDDPSTILQGDASSSWLQQGAVQHSLHQEIGPKLDQQQQQLQPDAKASAASQALPRQEQSAAAVQGALGSSVSKWVPCAEESSWLSAECSKVLDPAQEPSSSCLRRTAMPAANRAMLLQQVKVKVEAVTADPSTLKAVRDRQQQTDERLQQLLLEHRSSEGKRLQAVRRRQRLLHKADMLHSHLKQLPPLEQVSDVSWPAQYSLPRPGSCRFARAQQAHAMSLGEARVQQRWWGQLKQLNHLFAAHAVGHGDVSGLLQSPFASQQDEAAWRGSWASIREQEQRRS